MQINDVYTDKLTVHIMQDFFRKLKFKYLEQEAKLEFIQSITSESPKLLEPGENNQRGRHLYLSYARKRMATDFL